MRNIRLIIRWIVLIVSVVSVIYFQRTTGTAELRNMFIALGGILWTLWDYNRDFTHRNGRLDQ